MHVFDASSIIHAWDNYPIQHFPPLWQWLVAGATLVSDEGRQFLLPDVLAKYKVPAVCALKDVNIDCVPFIEVIKGSGAIFG